VKGDCPEPKKRVKKKEKLTIWGEGKKSEVIGEKKKFKNSFVALKRNAGGGRRCLDVIGFRVLELSVREEVPQVTKKKKGRRRTSGEDRKMRTSTERQGTKH